MKICAACVQELPQTSFSKKQWQSKQYQRRCKECIDANRVVQLTAPPKTESTEISSPPLLSTEDEGPSCWICLEEGPNEFGQPLRRDCSCRGESSGFAHLSCIFGYAEVKSRSAARFEEFSRPWEFCPSCKQRYQNDLALDLAGGFVAFVEGTYPDDQHSQLHALDLKFKVLVDLAANLQPNRKDEAEQLGFQIITIAQQMRTEGSSDFTIQFVEADVYNRLGTIAQDGTKEGARTALGYFEKSRDISEAIGDADGVAHAESNAATLKTQYEGMTQEIIEDLLEKRQKFHLKSIEKYGQENTWTLEAGQCYASTLYKAIRVIEAERLYTRLAADCRRVNGPDHHLTKGIESVLQWCKVRQVAIKFQSEWKRFQALRYDEDGKKCVVQGPLQVPRNTQEERTITVNTNCIIYLQHTPVVCHGAEGSLEYLNGKIGDVHSVNQDTGSYEVHFQDKGPCTVHHKNIRILFEVPDEYPQKEKP